MISAICVIVFFCIVIGLAIYSAIKYGPLQTPEDIEFQLSLQKLETIRNNKKLSQENFEEEK